MIIAYVSIYLSIFAGVCFGLGVDVKVPGTSVNVGTNGVSMTPKDEPVTFGKPECKTCTNYITGHIDTYRNALKLTNLSEAVRNKVPQCGNCTVKYIDTADIYGDVCVTPVPNAVNQTYTRTNLAWKNITVGCLCKFESQGDLLNAFTKAQTALGTCGNNDTSVDTTTLTDSAAFLATNDALKTLSTCFTTSGGKVIPEETLNLTVLWDNFKFTVTVQKDKNLKGPNSATFVKGGILQRNVSDINLLCHSDISTTSTACKCIDESGIAASLIDTISEFVVGCVFRQNKPNQRAMYDSYLVCDN